MALAFAATGMESWASAASGRPHARRGGWRNGLGARRFTPSADWMAATASQGRYSSRQRIEGTVIAGRPSVEAGHALRRGIQRDAAPCAFAEKPIAAIA